MKHALAPTLFLTLLLGAPLAGARLGSTPLPSSERSNLQALHQAGSSRLEGLRAGAPGVRAGLSLDERASMRSASRSDLSALRGGDLNLSDEELRIVLITAAVVLLIIVIA
jgi:hypothetical protein